MRQCSHELAPLAQLAGCLAVWTSPACVHHRRRALHKPRQDWMSSCELLSEAPVETSQIRSHSIFHIQHSALCQPVALRAVHGSLLHLDSHTWQLQRSCCGLLEGRFVVDENLCKATARHEISKHNLSCTFRWHNGRANPAITITLANQNRSSCRLLQLIVSFLQVTVLESRSRFLLHDADAFGHARCNTHAKS